MFQEGTDKALDDLVQRPALPKPVPKPGFWAGSLSAAPRGVGAGVAESIAYRAETAGAFGEVTAATGAFSAGGMFATQSEQERKDSEAARRRVLAQGPTMSNEAGDLFRERAKELMPDPETTGTAAHVIAGLTRFGAKAVGYLAGGPAGVVDLGVDEGLTEADRLKQQGVDIGTRTQAGAVAGVVAGGSVLVPLSGATAASRFVKGVAVGESTMVGQSVAERAILENAGYDKIASTFDPFDPVALAVGLVPGVLGARFGHAAPKPLESVKTEADVRRAAALTPDEQARSDAFERSAANLRELEAAVKAEKDSGKRLLLVDELEKQRTAARNNYVKDSMRADPDLEPAARVRQVADALDESRLTPDTDLRGIAAHQEAIETAHEQMARGEPVNVPEVALPMLAHDVLPIDPAFVLDDHGLQPQDRAYTINTVDAVREAQDLIGTDRLEALAEQRMQGVEPGARWEAAQAAQVEMAARRVVDFYDRAPEARTRAAELNDRPATAARAITELRAARDQAQNPPHAERQVPGRDPADVASRVDGDRSRADGKRAGDGSAAVPPKPLAAPTGDRSSEAAPGAAAAGRAAAEVAALNPDLLVQLDGMDAPMRVADLMAKVKQEAAEEAQMAKLVQVAAECALTA